jgi:hypothetical protein
MINENFLLITFPECMCQSFSPFSTSDHPFRPSMHLCSPQSLTQLSMYPFVHVSRQHVTFQEVSYAAVPVAACTRSCLGSQHANNSTLGPRYMNGQQSLVRLSCQVLLCCALLLSVCQNHKMIARTSFTALQVRQQQLAISTSQKQCLCLATRLLLT